MSLTKDEKLNLIRRTWNLENTGRVPFTIEVGFHHLAVDRFFQSHQQELAWHEAYYAAREGVADFDMPHIKPNLGIGTLAGALGCELQANDNADPWARSIITNDNTKKVYDLEKPDPADNPIYDMVRDRLTCLQADSDWPLRLVNVASPLVTASMMWDYTQFFIALMDHPREVHHLMELVTEATIDFVRFQLSEIKKLHTMSHEVVVVPPEVGLRVSDDTAALMSPKLYREFGTPYLEKISSAFGGLVVHSCGNCKHVIPAMMEISDLRGLDLTMPQNTSWEPLKQAAGRVALLLRHYYWDHADGPVDAVEYTEKLLEACGRRGVFIMTSAPDARQAGDLGQRLWPLLGHD